MSSSLYQKGLCKIKKLDDMTEVVHGTFLRVDIHRVSTGYRHKISIILLVMLTCGFHQGNMSYFSDINYVVPSSMLCNNTLM